MKTNYFYSWSKQDSPSTLKINKTTNDTYICTDGNEVYDLSSCSYHLSFGLRNEEIIRVIKDQYDDLPVAGPKLDYELKHETTKNLLEYLKLPTGKIFYTTSGAEAVENALKMARRVSGKKHVIARNDSYHGASTGALSVGGDWRSDNHLTTSEYTLRIPKFNTPESLQILKDHIEQNKDIAAIILETITGGNGVIEADKSWWKEVQELCSENRIFIILDEVVCGFGRTGEDFAFHHYDIKPDFICLAKNITGGYFPFGAVYVDGQIANYYDDVKLSCGTTNFAHPVGLRICNKIISLLKSSSYKMNMQAIQDLLNEYQEKFEKASTVKEVRVKGLLMAIELNCAFISFKELTGQGLYLNYIGDNLIICPIYNTEITKLSAGLDKLLKIVEGLK